MLRRTCGLALTALLLAGCATARDGGSVSSEPSSTGSSSVPPSADPSTTPPLSTPPLSSTDLPTLKPPSAPPRTPTDDLPTDVIVGTVTAGGSGPCYGMEDNDGKQYALYGGGGISLTRGDTIRVKFEPFEA